MGGACEPNVDLTPSHKEVLSGTEIPEWVSKSGQELFYQAEALAEQPFQLHQGPRIQQFTADQLAGMDLTRAATGNYLPQYNAAVASAERGVTPWDTAAATQYMNPYTQGVTDIAARELNRNYDVQRLSEDAQATGAGGFGGDRHALLNAENERNRNLALGDLYQKSQNQAYQNAQQMFLQDQNRALGGATTLSGLATAGQTLSATDASMLQGIGQQQQLLEQASLDTAYADYLEQREYPYRQVNFALGALKGTPYETRAFSQTAGVTPQLTTSPFGQAAGALGGLIGGYSLFSNPAGSAAAVAP